ncbi:MAG: hypothetical protein H6872_05565 [Methylobacteriaceae bacterium]|nr:hypothetical protein [Methylobacteriaceae bacterium]
MTHQRDRVEAEPPKEVPRAVVSLRLDKNVIREFKMEAARRGLKLNECFELMLTTFREKTS